MHHMIKLTLKNQKKQLTREQINYTGSRSKQKNNIVSRQQVDIEFHKSNDPLQIALIIHMQMQACAPFLLFTAKLLTGIGWRVRIIGREGPKIS